MTSGLATLLLTSTLACVVSQVDLSQPPTDVCPSAVNPEQHLQDDRIALNILGLFAMTGVYPAGRSYLLTALLAAMKVNEDENMLPGYRLVIKPYNTNVCLMIMFKCYFHV